VLKEFGKDLKRLRELKGVSVAEIAAETRINPKFINLLESGKFDFQPDTYIRSFLKEYARAIDEDEKRILSDYDKAKAGFYSPRKFEKSDTIKSELSVTVKAAPVVTKTEKPPEPVYQKNLKSDKPDYLKKKAPEPEFTNKSITQKILLGVLILAVITGIYFLIDYLNNSGDNKTNVKPKTFNEMSSEYEDRISGKNDSDNIRDSLKMLSADSLKLVVKALKDIRIIVTVDDNSDKIVEELEAKDTIRVAAARQFRFSTSNGINTELYLNGKYLRKPATTGTGSIKNMIITKDGISSKEQ
jgi:cytoskeletal protein RodZ